MIAVTVDEIKSINRGNLRAFVTIPITGTLTTHSLRIVDQPGQAALASMPQAEAPGKNGAKSRWHPIVEIHDERLKQQISDVVLTVRRGAAQPEPPRAVNDSN